MTPPAFGFETVGIGFEVVGSETEKLGLFAVTLARKPAYLSFPKR